MLCSYGISIYCRKWFESLFFFFFIFLPHLSEPWRVCVGCVARETLLTNDTLADDTILYVDFTPPHNTARRESERVWIFNCNTFHIVESCRVSKLELKLSILLHWHNLLFEDMRMRRKSRAFQAILFVARSLSESHKRQRRRQRSHQLSIPATADAVE